MPIVSPSLDISSPLKDEDAPSFVRLKCHGFLLAWPRRQDTHGGALFLSFQI